MEVNASEVKGGAKLRKARVFASKVFLVTVSSPESPEGTGSQFLVRGAKTELGARRAALEGLVLTSKQLESCELLDLLKAGAFPPEITVAPDESADDEGEDGVQGQDAGCGPEAKAGLHSAETVPVEAFSDDQGWAGSGWEHGREFA